jgi:mono/diheme cytochrome c family protein
MRTLLKFVLLCAAVVAALAVVTVLWISSHGISAKAEPGPIETLVARTMRHWAIPRADRALANPVVRSSDVIAGGMAHFADHCAVCHANDGSGDTALGRGLYPKPSDMRLAATQSLTDGELFYIIENGIRLTGMPAWSTETEEGRQATWHLVHFIRELPRLPGERIEEMRTLNPRSPTEIRQEIEEQQFLSGTSATPAVPTSPHTH